ncbi:MAG: hypothetical protein ACREOO_25570 [bacterium]
MSIRLHFLIVFALFLFIACVQRTDTPPGSRDGVAGGSNIPPTQQARGPQDTKSTDRSGGLPEVGFEEKFELGDNQYTVLVQTCATEQQAQELSYLLRMNRVSNFIDHVRDEWLVCIGKYNSVKGAQNTLALLHRRGAVRQLVDSGYGEPSVYGPGHGL